MKKLLLATVIISITSCGFSVESEEDMDKLYNSVPDIEFINMERIEVKRGKVQYIARSGKTQMFDNKEFKQTTLTDLSFEQFDKNGKTVTNGNADMAEVYSKTSNVQITGNVFVNSTKQKAKIKTEYIYWDDKAKIIKGNNKEEVTIQRDDGTTISGLGFQIKTKSNTAEFSSNVRGSYISDPEKEDE